MRFLVVSKQKHQVPVEHAVPLIDAFSAFIDKYTESGQLEDSWSCVGSGTGGGIANVDSLEELDTIMAEFPFAPFSEVEIYPLVDTKKSLQRAKQRIQAMTQMVGG